MVIIVFCFTGCCSYCWSAEQLPLVLYQEEQTHCITLRKSSRLCEEEQVLNLELLYYLSLKVKFEEIWSTLVLNGMFFVRYPPSLFKELTSTYNLSKKDAIIWGVSNEDVAIQKYCTFGDAVVEKTGK